MRERDRQERVANLMAQVGLADIPLTQRVTALSGGQAQRIAIAICSLRIIWMSCDTFAIV